MEKKTLISFCMSTYKRPEILKAQIKNILKQEYQHFELVISDNDPQESAKNVVIEFNDTRIKYYCNGINLGMVKSFNKSIERSSGEYIVMITDDDPIYPNMLSTLINLKNKYPNYGVYAGCGSAIIENEFAKLSLRKEIGNNSYVIKTINTNAIIAVKSKDFAGMYLDGFFSKTFLLWSCCIVDRSVINKIEGMPDYGSELLTDHAFMISACSQKGMVYINQELGGQSIRDNNFGYDFDKLKDKYIKTPELFYGYLKHYLQNIVDDWDEVEKKLWNFIGRGWVEYSLQIFQSLKIKRKSTEVFFDLFNIVFSNRKIHKWKYKFYLKAYCRPFFNLLLVLKEKPLFK